MSTVVVKSTCRNRECHIAVDWPDGRFSLGTIDEQSLESGEGDTLYRAAFNELTVDALLESTADAGEMLRIELRVGSTVTTAPWENMTDPRGVTVATHPRLSLVRAPERHGRAIQRVALDTVPGAIFLDADPAGTGLPPLDADEYWRGIEPILRSFPFRVERQPLHRRGLEQLSQRREPAHLVHLLAHGRASDGGWIALRDPSSNAVDWCRYAEFAERLTRLRDLRTVVLHTCESLPLGLMLAEKGLAVVAWNGRPDAALPPDFWRAFYGNELGRELDLAEGARVARRMLHDLGRREWSQLTLCTPSGGSATATVSEALRASLARQSLAQAEIALREAAWSRLAELQPPPLAGGDDCEALSSLGRAWQALADPAAAPALLVSTLRPDLDRLRQHVVPPSIKATFNDVRRQLDVAHGALERLVKLDAAAVDGRLDEACKHGDEAVKSLAGAPLADRAVGGRVTPRASDVQRIACYDRFLADIDKRLAALARDRADAGAERWRALQVRAANETPWEEPHAGLVTVAPARVAFYDKLFDHRKELHRLLREALARLTAGVNQRGIQQIAEALQRLAGYSRKAESRSSREALTACADRALWMMEAAVAAARETAAAVARGAAKEPPLSSLRRVEALGRDVMAGCGILDRGSELGIPALKERLATIQEGINAACASLVDTVVLTQPSDSARIQDLLARDLLREGVQAALTTRDAPASPALTELGGTPLDALTRFAEEIERQLANGRVDAAALVRRLPGIFSNATAPPLLPDLVGTPLHPYLMLAEHGARPDTPLSAVALGADAGLKETEALATLRDPERRLRLDIWLFPVENPRRFEGVLRGWRQTLLSGGASGPPTGPHPLERAALHCLLGQPDEGAALLWEQIRHNPRRDALCHAALLCELVRADGATRSDPGSLPIQHWRRLVASLGLLPLGPDESYIGRFRAARRVSHGSDDVPWDDAALDRALEQELRHGVVRRLEMAATRAIELGRDGAEYTDLVLAIGAELEGAACLRELRGIDAGNGGPVACGRLGMAELGLDPALGRWFAAQYSQQWRYDRDRRGGMYALVRNFTALWRPSELLKAGDLDGAEEALRALVRPDATGPELLGDPEEARIQMDARLLREPIVADVEPAAAAEILGEVASGLCLMILAQRAANALPPAGVQHDRRAAVMRAIRRAMTLARARGEERRIKLRLADAAVCWCDAWLRHLNHDAARSPDLMKFPLSYLRPIYWEFFVGDDALALSLATLHHRYAVRLVETRSDYEGAIDEIEAALALKPDTAILYTNLAIAVQLLALQRARCHEQQQALEVCDHMLPRIEAFLATNDDESVRTERDDLRRIRNQIAGDTGDAPIDSARPLRLVSPEHSSQEDHDGL